MKFKRINVDTVRCLITEEELTRNGLEVEDFLANDGKTESFLREIINKAEEEVGYKVQGGNISVQVSVLPEHVIALTFSEKAGNGIINMLENLKSAVDHLSQNVKQEAEKQDAGEQELVDGTEQQKMQDSEDFSDKTTKEEQPVNIPIMGFPGKQDCLVKEGRLNYQIQFDSLDTFIAYCNAIRLEMPVENSLFKLQKENVYILLMKKEPMNDRQLCRLLSASLEFNSGIFSHNGMMAYVLEHGECLIPDNAIQKIQEMEDGRV